MTAILKKEETQHLEERPKAPLVGGMKGPKKDDKKKANNPLNEIGSKGGAKGQGIKGPVVGTAKHPPGDKKANNEQKPSKGCLKKPLGPPVGTAKSPPPSPGAVPTRNPVPIDTPKTDETAKGNLPPPPPVPTVE